MSSTRMDKQSIKNFIDGWLLPPKLKVHAQIVRDKIKNRLKYGTEVFKKNEALRDIHVNDRCFVIGTGPSINKQDLTKLKDEIVIGVSGLYSHKDIEVFMPKYYVMSPVFRHHGNVASEETFVRRFQEMDEVLDDTTSMFLDIGDKPYIDKYGLFKNKEIYWMSYILWNEELLTEINLSNAPEIKTASETILTVALFLGFKEIYMLGFDHDWFNGTNHHFNQETYNKYFKSGKEISQESGFDSEFQMQAHATMFKKYKAFYALRQNIFNANANENTYVDTFPKVKYEELFG